MPNYPYQGLSYDQPPKFPPSVPKKQDDPVEQIEVEDEDDDEPGDHGDDEDPEEKKKKGMWILICACLCVVVIIIIIVVAVSTGASCEYYAERKQLNQKTGVIFGDF